MQYLAGYPLALIATADEFESGKKWAMAANYRSFCMAYLDQIEPAPDAAANRADTDGAPHLREPE